MLFEIEHTCYLQGEDDVIYRDAWRPSGLVFSVFIVNNVKGYGKRCMQKIIIIQQTASPPPSQSSITWVIIHTEIRKRRESWRYDS